MYNPKPDKFKKGQLVRIGLNGSNFQEDDPALKLIGDDVIGVVIGFVKDSNDYWVYWGKIGRKLKFEEKELASV